MSDKTWVTKEDHEREAKDKILFGVDQVVNASISMGIPVYAIDNDGKSYVSRTEFGIKSSR